MTSPDHCVASSRDQYTRRQLPLRPHSALDTGCAPAASLERRDDDPDVAQNAARHTAGGASQRPTPEPRPPSRSAWQSFQSSLPRFFHTKHAPAAAGQSQAGIGVRGQPRHKRSSSALEFNDQSEIDAEFHELARPLPRPRSRGQDQSRDQNGSRDPAVAEVRRRSVEQPGSPSKSSLARRIDR